MKERVIRERMSPELLKKLTDFSSKVTRKTPRFKFEILTDWLEHEILKMVLERQVRNKTFTSILKPDVKLEEREGVRGSVESASQIVKNSVLGRDPFGDHTKNTCRTNAMISSMTRTISLKWRLS